MRRPSLSQTAALTRLERRSFLGQSLSVGALAMLSGCDISNDDQVQTVLGALSRWNDRAQAWLFSGNRLAPTFAASQAVKEFRYNAYFPADKAPVLAADDYRLKFAGLIEDRRPWTLQQLYALPQVTQVTRHVCVEVWSMIGQWSGAPLASLLQTVGADLTAGYLGYECADGYYGSIDMPTALHPQTIMAFKLSDEILPRKYGYPFKIRIPTKLGFKNPKWITTLYVTNRKPGGFWEDRGYNWFSGL